MLTLLLSLIVIHLILDKAPLSKAGKVCCRLPFSLYFGWITMATVANITAFLVRAGWDRFDWPEQAWAVIILLAAMAIGTATMVIRKGIAYGLVLVWVYIGILINHVSQNSFGGAHPAVIVTAIARLVIGGCGGMQHLYYEKDPRNLVFSISPVAVRKRNVQYVPTPSAASAAEGVLWTLFQLEDYVQNAKL